VEIPTGRPVSSLVPQRHPRAARLAGRYAATRDITSNRTETTANVAESVGSTPKSILVSTRVKANAPAKPATKPIAINFNASRKTAAKTCRFVAPSAVRYPILSRPRLHRVSQHTVEPDRGETRSQCRETAEQKHLKAARFEQ
jgi:hypothetical protein